ncbi:hypothetical protein [Lewinella sp. 4G2]|uniref:hypothetical protein n=1 Tax=Lewinella sp. 4G2 TaxID=1803372 RepID=UPI0007B49FC1|nr:hypothetical protein [Lewinella sp. 4G2]OAV45386.1 hypothetical protein A3850_013185 [Lewinella sp. 4G2]
MSASLVGLIIEVVLFASGLYLYLFARGIVKLSDSEVGQRARAFRDENSTWMRLLGLALAAIMALNIFAHFTEL